MCVSSNFIPVKNFNLENELETILRNIDEPIPIEINNGKAKKIDLNKIELERATRLVDFCRGLLCGLKVGKNNG
jgi:hypothetical protein